MGHNLGIDYAQYTKRGVLLAVGCCLLGAVLAIGTQALYGGLPPWEQTFVFDIEILGIFIGLVSVFGFGIVLPLTE